MRLLKITILVLAVIITPEISNSVSSFELNLKGSDPHVQTSLGGIKGHYKTSSTGRKYAAFEGIPYALPPTGERRFEPPHRIPAWLKDIEAKSLPNFCIQSRFGDEDCLYLNIYVPTDVSNESLPVLFWIHGGGFGGGSGSFISTKNIMNKDLILVTSNYRLGVFGFLSTGDEVLPGNMGLKDQNMALRWVSENIRFFGGDPKKITLAGESAGAASVHYHYLSPMSKGLFQNGISFSGTAMAPFAYMPNPKNILNLLAEETDCKKNSSVEIVGCLKRMPADIVLKKVRKISRKIDFSFPYMIFVPVSESSNVNYFINSSPKDILEKGPVYDVPWVNANTKDEGSVVTAAFINKKEVISYINDNWRAVAPYLLQYAYSKPETEYTKLADSIREHYFHDNAINANMNVTHNLTQVLTDYWFLTSSIRAAKMQAKINTSPVWSYLYTYKAAGNDYYPSLMNIKDNLDVLHCDDVMLVLNKNITDPSTTPCDRAMVENMLNFWFSFANTGIPKLSNEWAAVNPNPDDFEYLQVAGPTDLAMERNDNFGDVQFWSSIGF